MIARLFKLLALFLSTVLGVAFVAGSFFGAFSRSVAVAFLSGWHNRAATAGNGKTLERRGIKKGIFLALLGIGMIGVIAAIIGALVFFSGVIPSKPVRATGRLPSGFCISAWSVPSPPIALYRGPATRQPRPRAQGRWALRDWVPAVSWESEPPSSSHRLHDDAPSANLAPNRQVETAGALLYREARNEFTGMPAWPALHRDDESGRWSPSC